MTSRYFQFTAIQFCFLLCWSANFQSLNAQTAHKNLRNGDMLYGFGKFQEAETEYRKADEKKPSVKSSYNLGNTLVQQERYEEALKKYQDASTKTSNDNERANIYYNKGNAHFKKQEYKESIDAYKQSLKYQPMDQAAKENLAMARMELRKQQQQNKENKDNKDNKDQKDNKQNQDQNNKDNKDKEDQQNKEQDQKQDQDQNNQQQNENKTSEKKMSKEDAQKLLEIMDSEEKKVQQKLRRIDSKNKKVIKDW